MSPVKMLRQILQSYQPRYVKAANDYNSYDVMIEWSLQRWFSLWKKSKNDWNLDNFSFFHSISLSTLIPSHQWQRVSRAQSSQNMRAQELNREHRARGLALKSGLIGIPLHHRNHPHQYFFLTFTFFSNLCSSTSSILLSGAFKAS